MNARIRTYTLQNQAAKKYTADDQTAGDLTLTIDFDEVFRVLGGKALTNSTRKAQVMKGAVSVKATNVRTIPKP